MIKKDSPLPIYYQLEEAIKESISQGEYEPGSVIPSEREFSETYNISRMTVRQAITNLVKDGYLIRKRGKGTYVASQKIEQSVKGLTGFSEDMRARGMEPETNLIEFNHIPAPRGLAEKLGIQEGDAVYEIKRLRLADGIPMAYEMLYMARELIPDLTEEIVNGSIYEYVEKKLGLSIKRADQILEASIARKAEADILEIKEGAPILFIQRNSFLKDERPLEVVKSYYRGDRYKFSFEMER